jgi:hypothetical protein
MDFELEMARRSYGYGRWDAPYWFIGPEQGKGQGEPSGNSPRVRAWQRLGGTELCDCLDFHAEMPDMSWHCRKPNLQRTWRPLILLLKTFLDQPSDLESLRAYQRDRWGRVKDGETCVIELSGLAVRSSKIPAERDRFREERITIIRQRMLSYKPVLIVMYGLNERPHWEKIAGMPLVCDGVARVGTTRIAFAPHPQDRGRRNSDWTVLAAKLRLSISPMVLPTVGRGNWTTD